MPTGYRTPLGVENEILKLLELGYSQRHIAREILGDTNRESLVRNIKRRNIIPPVVDSSIKQPKMLLLDIETSAAIVGAFQRWDVNVSQAQVFQESMLLGLVTKWFGDDNYIEIYPTNFKNWSDKDEQKGMLEKIWRLLDQADYVIGQNSNKFDIPYLNAQFLLHGFSRPSPYKRIDTLRMAKRHFRFPSNSLDSLGEFLGLGRKTKHNGFELWRRCMSGETGGFREMIDYNVQDVNLLEQVYLKLRPWDSTHPNISFQCDDDYSMRCGVCGSDNLEQTGKFAYTNVSQFPLYKCGDCHSWHRTRKASSRSSHTLIGVN